MIPGGVCSARVAHADCTTHDTLFSCKPVVQHSISLQVDQLVSVTQYHRERLGPPLAVGRMAVTSDTLRESDAKGIKGKAVYVLHTWKDHLWDMGTGSKQDVPETRETPRPTEEPPAESDELGQAEGEETGHDVEELADATKNLRLDEAGTAEVETGSLPGTSTASEAADDGEQGSTTLTPEGTAHLASQESAKLKVRRRLVVPSKRTAAGAANNPCVGSTIYIPDSCINVLVELRPTRSTRTANGRWCACR